MDDREAILWMKNGQIGLAGAIEQKVTVSGFIGRLSIPPHPH